MWVKTEATEAEMEMIGNAIIEDGKRIENEKQRNDLNESGQPDPMPDHVVQANQFLFHPCLQDNHTDCPQGRCDCGLS